MNQNKQCGCRNRERSGGNVVTFQIPDTAKLTRARFLYPGRAATLEVTRDARGFLQIKFPPVTTGGIIVIE